VSALDSPSTDDGLLALSFYFVIDVSYSMENSGALQEASAIVPQVVDAISKSPVLADVVRVGLIDFSDDAQVVLRLDDVRNIHTIPQLVARGGTSFAAAFKLLIKEIEADRAQLKSSGYKMYRPAVFFITDGAPTDPEDVTRSAFADLTDPSFKARPNIIPFGVDQATKEQLDLWVYPPLGSPKAMRSYVADPGRDPADAIKQLAEVLISSIVASAGSVQDHGTAGGFIPPDDDDLDEWV
jgi:uncharacterized protein YegL